MPLRFARVAFSPNSVRGYSPPDKNALYAALSPNANWYDDLRAKVASFNREAISTVGTNVDDRLNYLQSLRRQYNKAYPNNTSRYLDSVETSAPLPIVRDRELIAQYAPGNWGILTPEFIAIDPKLNPGLANRTIIHELAHKQLDHLGANAYLEEPIQEFQAEAVARGVREKLGVRAIADLNDSAAYIAMNLTKLAGQEYTPKGLFSYHQPVIFDAVEAIAPVVARPFERVITSVYRR